jgi:hypothetical protein
MPSEARAGVYAEVEKAGYPVAYVGLDRCGTMGVQREAIRMSSLFVGTDGPTASVAFTTDVPAAVCYTWRDLCYFAPVSKGIPFEAMVHGVKDCDMGKVCLAQNGFSEYGKVYRNSCPKQRPFACRDLAWPDMVRMAVVRMEDKACSRR